MIITRSGARSTAVQIRYAPAISAQRTMTDDVSDCVISQNDDVITSANDEQQAEPGSPFGGVHEEERRPTVALPLVAVHNGQSLAGGSSKDVDEVGLVRDHIGRRTLSLRRRVLTADTADLIHEQVVLFLVV